MRERDEFVRYREERAREREGETKNKFVIAKGTQNSLQNVVIHPLPHCMHGTAGQERRQASIIN